MNLQCPKLIMRNDSIGIETLPTLALFLHTSSFTFCNHLIHTQCLPTVFWMFQLFRVFQVFQVFRVFHANEKNLTKCAAWLTFNLLFYVVQE